MAKFSYEITIPNAGTFVIDSDRELSDKEAYDAVLASQRQEPASSFGRTAGILARGAAPVAAGAGAGFLVGGAPGAFAGSLTLPLAELATQGLNVALPENMQIPSPTGAVENLLTQAGFPVPISRGERVTQAIGSGAAGTFGQLSTLPTVAKTATTELGRGLATAASQQPVRQIAATAPSAAAAQVAGEEFGPVAGQLAGMAAAAPFSVGAKPRQVEQIPTTQELRQTSRTLYKMADDAGVQFNQQEVQSFAAKTANDLTKAGIDPDIHPKAYKAMQRLIGSADNPVSLSELDTLRRVALGAATSADAAERAMGSKLIERIDSFIENASPSQISSQDKKAIEALREARQLWKTQKKVQILENIFDVAELRAGTNFTQSGMEQALRSRLTNLAANEKLMRQFNKTEQEAIREAAKGGKMQNFFRYVGKLAPTSVIPAVGGAYLGTQAFGDVGALAAGIPAAAGAGSREIATRMGIRNFGNLENMLRLGRQPRTPVSGVSSIITRGLIAPQQEPLDVTEEQLRLISGR